MDLHPRDNSLNRKTDWDLNYSGVQFKLFKMPPKWLNFRSHNELVEGHAECKSGRLVRKHLLGKSHFYKLPSNESADINCSQRCQAYVVSCHSTTIIIMSSYYVLVLSINIQLIKLRLKAFPVRSMKYIMMDLFITNISRYKNTMCAITPKTKPQITVGSLNDARC